MSFCYDSIDFSLLDFKLDNKTNNDKLNQDNHKLNQDNDKLNQDNDKLNRNNYKEFDKTTTESYRIKRLFKIDPITDTEIPEQLSFNFIHTWNPYNGLRGEPDIIGPLCFNAINLYDYFYSNRFKGLWNPPEGQFQGYYGDLVGTGKNINIKSRGSNPERYLYRLPIIDCYLSTNHNYSIITMGPELTDNEISQIDSIILKSHPKKTNSKFASLTMLKYYYDRAIDISPDPDSDEIKELNQKYPNLSEKEINDKYNRYWVDKLVNLIY
jgi:hypothetical protein